LANASLTVIKALSPDRLCSAANNVWGRRFSFPIDDRQGVRLDGVASRRCGSEHGSEGHSSRPYAATQGIAMRPSPVSETAPTVPEPGTAEAIALGCTCRVIAHQAASEEAEPAGMLLVPDANCPIHSTPTQPWQAN
jgi:hypothetical protein